MNDQLDNRWAIAIDIEGFSSEFMSYRQGTFGRNEALWRLNILTEGICKIASIYNNHESNRFFAHQVGDGFIILSDFGEKTLESAVIMASALLRYLAVNGALGKAFIAEGNSFDCRGCRSEWIRAKLDGNIIKMGKSFITVSSVVGTAWVHAFEGLKRAPSGSLLLANKHDICRLPNGVHLLEFSQHKWHNIVSINWVTLDVARLQWLSDSANLSVNNSQDVKDKICQYISDNQEKLIKRWIKNTQKYLGLSTVRGGVTSRRTNHFVKAV